MDACGDPDPRLDCASYTRLAVDEDGCFSPAPLLGAVRRLSQQQPGLRLCYGSGFEARPGLLREIMQWLPVLGNHPDTVARCQNPALSRRWLRPLTVPHPDTWAAADSRVCGPWLIKRTGGTGGGHVRRLHNRRLPHPARDYLQRYVAGKILSVVFVASGRDFRVVGFNRQYNGDRHCGEFVFSGAITHVPKPRLRTVVDGWLRKLIPALQLRGLCGIDLIAPANSRPLLLEINPRPPATWPLHIPDLTATDGRSDAFSWHIQGCQRQLPAGSGPETGGRVRAMRHLFAERTGRLQPVADWPDWVVNPPARRRCYHPGEPLCTVLAEGDDEQQTLDALQRRCRHIHHCLQPQTDSAPLRENSA